MPNTDWYDWYEEEPPPAESDGGQQLTRSSDHPDGFTFLQPPASAFWQFWLQFSSVELYRLNFLRWRFPEGR